MRVHVLLCQVVMLALSLSVSPCAQGYDGGGAAQASRQAVVKDDGNNVRAAGGPRSMEYLAVAEAEKRWTMKTRNWPEIMAQLSIFFQGRLQGYLC